MNTQQAEDQPENLIEDEANDAGLEAAIEMRNVNPSNLKTEVNVDHRKERNEIDLVHH